MRSIDQREKDVHPRRGSVQGLSRRVRHVLELLPRTQIRGGPRLHVLEAALQNPLQNPQPPSENWLHFKRVCSVSFKFEKLICFNHAIIKCHHLLVFLFILRHF